MKFEVLKTKLKNLSRPNQIAAGLLLLCMIFSALFFLVSSPDSEDKEIASLRSYVQPAGSEPVVIIRNNVYAKTDPSLNAPVDYRIPAYTKGVYEGTTKDGLAVLRIAQTQVFVDSSLLKTDPADPVKKERLVNSSAVGRETPSLSSKTEEEILSKSDEEWLKEKEEYIKDSVGETMSDTGWGGPNINSIDGTVDGPSGKETYYNLPMEGVVRIMTDLGFPGEYWVREDGVKMMGDFVMIATNLDIRPRGSLVPTSMGMGLVCDTGTFAETNPYQIDIAVDWK